VAYFVDSIFIGCSAKGINPDLVESLNIVKKPITIEGITYENRIHISCKETPSLLSLSQVIEKYLQTETYTPIFLINETFLTGNISSLKVDDNYILKVESINSDQFENIKNLDIFSIITIFTKTKENMKQSKITHIR
jgi:hypothetical protein